ncbi:Tryptase alpha/beta-1 [Larimichthys crocea]|uniref:Tryptase alpha/beta-1 n=1 Tax=Larimichthys crocea TaxID=215358 RepID=A0A6G0HWB5_LARCR|nr:Tryptase alpha/beta-1 [Larimichthys crocea]
MAFYGLVPVLVLILNTGGSLEAEVRSSIIGGQDAPKGSWPWMAHLNITSDDKNRWRCGGAILSDQWVLTAANCLDAQRRPNWRRSFVSVGSHSLTKASARYMGIDTVMTHREYQAQSGGYVNDIALVKLKKKLTFSPDVASVTLPSIDDTFGSSSECWIAGWGNIGTNVPLPDPETLQQLKIPIISQSACKAKYPELTDDMLCAGSQDGGMDACKGDYGGPLVCRKGSGFVQAGIMSYGSPDGCGLPGRPGVYTKVSKYLRFINDYIKMDSAEV